MMTEKVGDRESGVKERKWDEKKCSEREIVV